MADNITLNVGSGGDVLAADDISGSKYQRVKVIHGADGVNGGDVSTTNPLPTKLYATLPDSSNGAIRSVGLGFQNSTPLANSATYDSGILSLEGYTQVQTHILSDVTGTMTVDFVRDAGGIDILRTLTIPYTAADLNKYQMFAAPAFTPYVRYRFQATGGNQSDFYFDTKFLTTALSPQLLGVDAFISPLMTSTLGRSVLVGKTQGNIYKNVAVSSYDDLHVDVQAPLTAFGELSVASPTAVAQVDFVYGLNNQQVSTSNTGTGSVVSSNGTLLVSTSAANASSAQCSSKRYIKYRPGQGALGRFTAYFTTGVADSAQYAGIGTPDMNNGFFFGYDGTSFGIAHIVGGNTTWIPQASWNVDTCLGTGGATNPSGISLNPTYGNVFQIKYQYLGYGGIYFYIENTTTGQFEPVHVIRYANTTQLRSLDIPSLNLIWRAVNTLNQTNIVVGSASGALFLEGDRRLLGPRYGFDNYKTSISTETSIFTLRNATTYNGKLNTSKIRLRTLSYGANAGGGGAVGIGIVRLKINATLDGSPSWTPINGSTADSGVTITSGQSTISRDIAGTTLSGGTQVFSATFAIGSDGTENITDLDIVLDPGDTMTFSLFATSAATASIAVSWTEDI